MAFALSEYEGNVEVQIDGWALSMGSILAISGNKTTMAKNGRMMLHGPSLNASGTEEDLMEAATLAKGYKEQLSDIYAAKTGKEPEEFVALLSERKDHWYTAEEAKAMGLVDEIIEPAQVAACASKEEIIAFSEIPEDIIAALETQPLEPDELEAVVDKDTVENIVEEEPELDPVAVERSRNKSIMAACRTAGKPHLAENYIDRGYALDMVQDLLSEIKASQEETPPAQISSQTESSSIGSSWGDAYTKAGMKTN
jgi:hypothetical protein